MCYSNAHMFSTKKARNLFMARWILQDYWWSSAGDCTPCGWLSLRFQVGQIYYYISRVGLCENLPVACVFGSDWQSAINVRIIFDSNGKTCITIPSSYKQFSCVLGSGTNIIGCISKYDYQNATKLDLNTLHENQNIFKGTSELFLTNLQQEELDKLVNSFKDIFSTPNNELGLFSDLELEIHYLRI